MTFALDFRRVLTRDNLVYVLGVDDALFDAVLAFDPEAGVVNFSDADAGIPADIPIFIRHDIPKKNPARGHRTVWEPVSTGSVHKALARRLEGFFQLTLEGYPHDSVFGYRKGRNIRENAARHAGNKHLLVLDIDNFFPSISERRVAACLGGAGITPSVAKLLASFVTIGGALPLGLPTSPALSNAILLSLDMALTALATEHGATYTRYADDLSFSSDGALPSIGDVRALVEANDFKLAEAKTRSSKIGQTHYVTGLSVSDPKQSHAPKPMKRRLRQEMYYARKYGLEDHFQRLGVNDLEVVQRQVNRLDGLVKFVGHQEPEQAARLKTDWNAILAENGMRRSFAPKNQHRSPFHIFVDEAEFTRGGQSFLALGVGVTQHADQIVDMGRAVIAKHLADPWADGNSLVLRKKGIHYSDATQDLKLAYVDGLRASPFEGYIIYDKRGEDGDYETTYLRLLASILPRRLKSAESQFVTVHLEVNDKVTQTAVRALIDRIFKQLEAINDRRPKAFSVQFLSKPHFGISVPDFLLGVLVAWLKRGGSGPQRSREELLFERLRDKYRLIMDLSAGVEYSRRNPISV
jgi:hypothetical protein